MHDEAAQSDDSVKVIILTGSGEKHLNAADIKELTYLNRVRIAFRSSDLARQGRKKR